MSESTKAALSEGSSKPTYLSGLLGMARRYRAYQRLRSRINQLLDDVGIPTPWTLTGFVENIESFRQRPIALITLPMPVEGPDGLYRPRPHGDLIGYFSDTDDLHREHIILHELCHLLLDHTGGHELNDPRNAALKHNLGIDQTDEDNGEGQTILHRQTYDGRQEWEAELAATIVWQRAGLRLVPSGPRRLTGADAEAADRLADVLERVSR